MSNLPKSLLFGGALGLATGSVLFYVFNKTNKQDKLKSSQSQKVSISPLQSQTRPIEIPASISQRYGLDMGSITSPFKNKNQQDNNVSDLETNNLNQQPKACFLSNLCFSSGLDMTKANKVKNPPDVTPVLVLHIFKKAMKEYLYSVHTKLSQLKKQGVKIASNNPQVAVALKSVNLDNIRQEILVKEGFDAFESSPSQVFAEALQKYSKENPNEFNMKLKKLQDQTGKVMKSLLSLSRNAVALIDALGDHFVVGGMSESRVKSLQASLILEKITELPAEAEDESNN